MAKDEDRLGFVGRHGFVRRAQVARPNSFARALSCHDKVTNDDDEMIGKKRRMEKKRSDWLVRRANQNVRACFHFSLFFSSHQIESKGDGRKIPIPIEKIVVGKNSLLSSLLLSIEISSRIDIGAIAIVRRHANVTIGIGITNVRDRHVVERDRDRRNATKKLQRQQRRRRRRKITKKNENEFNSNI